MKLLTKLLGVLSGTIHEWNAFISLDGDIAYFSEISTLDDFESNSLGISHPHRAGQSLRNIRQAFDGLENNRQRLVSLNETLSSDFSAVR
jgi:archaellum component FlaC